MDTHLTAEQTGRPFTAASFQLFLEEGRLAASQCSSCGRLHLPPRAVCPACVSHELSWVALGGEGTVAAFTSIYVAPSAMMARGYGRDNPYCVAIVTLLEGVRISGRLEGVDARSPESIAVGMPVLAHSRRFGEGETARSELIFEPLSPVR